MCENMIKLLKFSGRRVWSLMSIIVPKFQAPIQWVNWRRQKLMKKRLVSANLVLNWWKGRSASPIDRLHSMPFKYIKRKWEKLSVKVKLAIPKRFKRQYNSHNFSLQSFHICPWTQPCKSCVPYFLFFPVLSIINVLFSINVSLFCMLWFKKIPPL
jgi:hypothetical protein